MDIEIALNKLKFLAKEFQARNAQITDYIYWKENIDLLNSIKTRSYLLDEVTEAYSILFELFKKNIKWENQIYLLKLYQTNKKILKYKKVFIKKMKVVKMSSRLF